MKLDLENTADLDWALVHSDGVTELRIGSRLARDIGPDGLMESLRQFHDLVRLRIADDYIRTRKEITDYEESLETMFPGVAFSWTYDQRVDGKHGR